ncbi:Uncharacterized protein FWK35_00023496 [Aphis craccivora]|uniref:Uncharacterized protein n=1 Tax=Aphis craccivora TaxID=307492 RepID=A0A6G0YMD8_APHCR|nr:Uncharacterized protein FWK35_00023496 [Aphis craccivora]
MLIKKLVVIHLKKNLSNNSELSDECIDFTMIITSRNNAPFSNFEDGFRCKSEYPWYIIEVKTKLKENLLMRNFVLNFQGQKNFIDTSKKIF